MRFRIFIFCMMGLIVTWYIERRLAEEGKDTHRTSLRAMDALWNEAKRKERKRAGPKP